MENLNSDDKIDQNEELTEISNKNKSLITFSKVNFLFIFPILFAVFNSVSNLFESFIDDTKVIKRPHFIKSILYNLPNILAGLLNFLSCFRANEGKKRIKK